MSELIKLLTKAMNKRYQSSLTLEQVEYWVGSDTSKAEINELINEVIDDKPDAITPDDVIDLWREH